MKTVECDVLIKNIGQLLTISSKNVPLTNPNRESLGIIENAYLAIKDGKIIDSGSGRSRIDADRVIDADGCVTLPGFIDSHTHMIFGGKREREFSLRIRGKEYLTIMQEGGGIKSTVYATRAESSEDVFETSNRHLDRALAWGTTTCEVKSGYGLSTEDEIKILEVAQMLEKKHKMDIISTFLGAHEVPEEFSENKKGYVELLLKEMIPEVSKRKLAKFCDVFCEKGVFNRRESEKILKEGLKHGLHSKIHADEFSNIGASELSDKVNAVSCDHLLYTNEKGLFSMKKSGSIAVLLPGTNLFLMKKKVPPINKMRELRVPIAIASDFNPGSSPVIAMPVIISLSCLLYRMTPEEAIVGATINAACAIKKEDAIGSIEKGKEADIVIMDVRNYEEIPYWFAQNRILYVIKRGKVVAGKKRRNLN
ncbi:MAG: imidazolonepropionase [Candidatus Cloacimonadota bacterium]|nr:MAG: imidazolonepropionase [Candidatus Cloacimonadota bacterium]